MKNNSNFSNIVLLLSLTVILIGIISLNACVSREKKDDFLNPQPVKTEEKTESRIKVIEGGGFSTHYILEVDGHQYLANPAHGGYLHLESCPCKSK